MKILAVDTTHGDCSVALLSDGEVVSDITDTESGKQAERLLPIIEKALEESGLTYKELDAIAVNEGPGSFTGVRIGLAAVKGINLVSNTPLIGVSSFESVAYEVKSGEKNILVVLDAKRGQVYCQFFDKNINSLSEPELIEYRDILGAISENDFVLTGNGGELVSELLRDSGREFELINSKAVSNATNIVFIAEKKFLKGEVSHNIPPLYIRKPDAKKAAI